MMNSSIQKRFYPGLKRAVEKNDIDAIKGYLKYIDPSDDNNWAIRCSSELGYTEIVLSLLSDPRVDPSAGNNWPIRCASKNGHLEVVKLLLSDSRVDPSADNNHAIRYASYKYHLKVVRLLLSDPRVDFNAILNKEMELQLLKEEKNKLRKEFSFRYYVIDQVSPQILIKGRQKSKIPSALIRKIVYEASYQEQHTSIRLVALSRLNRELQIDRQNEYP